MIWRQMIATACAFACASFAHAGELGKREIEALRALSVGGTATVANLPRGTTAKGTIDGAVTLRRIEVVAPDARTLVATRNGYREIAREPRLHFVADGLRLGLSMSPDGRDASGILFDAKGIYVLGAKRSRKGLTITATHADDTLPSAHRLDGFCQGAPGGPVRIDAPKLSFGTPDRAASHKGAATPLRQAVVAVDTDNSWLQERFNDNETAATNYVADLFLAMNVMYEADLDLRLVRGTLILRPSSTPDPFPNADTAASGAKLREFGAWWEVNQAATPRVFAMLLSGDNDNASDGFSSTGIAWLIPQGNFCALRSGDYGAYSVTNMMTTQEINTLPFDARVVGHELGHNLGASHTHCTNAAGQANVAEGTLDQCFNGDADRGCYGGAVESCPAGPGSAGTIMSYCDLSFDCDLNALAFHPVHVSLLRQRVADNTPACMTIATETPVFANGFE